MGWHWGVLASSGGGAAGAYELISTTVLSSATASVSFSSIPSTYKHLQIRMVTRSSTNATTVAKITFNSTTTGYAKHRLYGNGSSVFSDATTSTTSFTTVTGPGTSDSSGIYMPEIIDILDYASTVKNKTIRAFSGAEMSNTGDVIGLVSGLWQNTSAITSILFEGLSASSFAIGSRFSLYGVKG